MYHKSFIVLLILLVDNPIQLVYYVLSKVRYYTFFSTSNFIRVFSFIAILQMPHKKQLALVCLIEYKFMRTNYNLCHDKSKGSYSNSWPQKVNSFFRNTLAEPQHAYICYLFECVSTALRKTSRPIQCHKTQLK